MTAPAVLLAAILGAALMAAAGFHVFWAFGGLWPARSEVDLSRTVVGEPRRQRMPGRAATLAVAACLAAAAACSAWLVAPFSVFGRLDAVPGFGLGAIFLARGVVGYVGAWQRMHPTEPFARLDRIAYAPLCLGLGVGFACLSVLRWSA